MEHGITLKQKSCNRRATYLLSSLLFLSGLASVAQAAPGDLDTTLGVGGKVINSFSEYYDQIEDVVIQADGKIVVAGFGFFALARYNSDGTLDSTFGTGGKVITSFNGAPPGASRAHALTIQPDGKIVAVGDYGGSYFAAARYHPNGSLDTKFGVKGKVSFYIGNAAEDVVIQTNGKILLAGGSLARLNSNGNLDNTFGSGGIVTTANIQHHAIALQIVGAEERIVGAGEAFVSGTADFSLVRYNTNGSIDTGFGLNGITTTSFGSGFDRAYDIAVYYPFNAAIVVVGHADNSSGFRNVALAKYDLNGNIDAGFGSGGKVMTALGSGHSEAFSLALDSNSNYVVAGYAERISGGTYNLDFAVLRYGGNGGLDSSFGMGGVVMTDFGLYDRAYGIAIQPLDNKLVAVGNTTPTGDISGVDYDFALARYLP